MKVRYVLFLLFLTSSAIAQNDRAPMRPIGTRAPMALDSLLKNSIGWLFKDNPQYYTAQPIWLPLTQITLSNVGLWLVDRYGYDYDFSHISFNSVSNNFKDGWTWRDTDAFANDFFFHPYSGAGYYMTARSYGYNFWECIPLVAFGSAEWKYFFENDQPSYADLINTTVNGTYVGEVGYRITSNVLDDSRRGWDRVWRELVVGLISPSRFVARLVTGKLWEVAPGPELEKQPMDTRLSLGPILFNNGNRFGSGPMKFDAALALEYGNPFEQFDRKPYDEFKIWMDFTNAYQNKYLATVTGYGYLAGSNIGANALWGIFQHFDYFNNLTFEFGDCAFGPGIITKLPLSEHHYLYANLFANFFPFGANNAGFFPKDTTTSIDYSYGDGFNGKAEIGASIGDHTLDIDATGEYIDFRSYYGAPVNNEMYLLKPRIALGLYHNLSVGLEDQIYMSHRLNGSATGGDLNRSEQRIFVQWNWDQFQHEQ
ncbi:MAG TPA: DUF3943 domain-containing protein [Candidatus Kapabacteria bacterium]